MIITIRQLTFIITMSLLASMPILAKENSQYLLSEKNWESLSEINQLLDSGQANAAITKLITLLPTVQNKAYDTAVTQQTLGHAYSTINDYPKAIEVFRRALDTNALPDNVNHDLNFNLAQLLILTKSYQEGLSYFNRWVKSESNPSLDAYILAGTAHYESDQFKSTIPYAKNIITLKPKYDETWHLILLNCYLKSNQYQNAAVLLEKMLHIQPENKIYWQQLLATWQHANNDQKTLATMELMFTKDLFSPEETKQLINMYLYMQMPHKAAKLLQAQLEASKLPRNAKNMELLGDCWLQAKEKRKSLDSLNWAAKQSGDSNLFYRVGQIYFDLENYPQAIKNLQTAITKGKLTQLDYAQLLLGIASFHEKNYPQSMSALQQALHNKSTKVQAEWWLQRIKDLKI